MKKVSVIVPAYNREALLPNLIEALLQQDYPSEIIIVDDGSTDNTAQIVKKYPAKYVYQKNSGPALARNRGVKESHGDIVVFTDSDCIPQKDWISRLMEGFTADDIGAVAGSYNIANPERLLACCIHEEIKLRHLSFKTYIKCFGSYNVAIKRNVFEEVEGFNENYRTASFEDNNLSYKILKAGHKIKFQGSALVAHRHTEKLWNYLKEQYIHGYWRMKGYKDFPNMAKGDDYTTFKDIIEIPLALITFCSAAFLWHRSGFIGFVTLTVANGLLQLPKTIMLIKIKKNFKFLYLPLITFLRSYARAFGAIKGILKFWLQRQS